MSATSFAEVVEGVRATIAAHAQAQDDGRTDDLVAAYCPDGVVEIPDFATYEGHVALREAFSQWVPQRPQRHVVTNTLVTEWDQKEAQAVSDVVFTQQGDAGWAIQTVARYHDTLHNDGGTWRIHRRAMEFVR